MDDSALLSWIDDVAGGGAPDGKALATALHDHVHARVRRPVAARSGTLVQIAARDRSDVAQDVLIKLVLRPELVAKLVHEARAEAQADNDSVVRRIHAYVERMLAHRYIDAMRRSDPELKEAAGEPRPRAEQEAPTTSGVDLEVAWPILERVAQESFERAPRARDRDQRVKTFRELLELGCRKVTMDELIGAEIRSDDDLAARTERDPEGASRVARNRLLQRHHRLRSYLLDTVDGLRATPGLTAPRLTEREAAVARLACEELLSRCHRKPRAESYEEAR